MTRKVTIRHRLPRAGDLLILVFTCAKCARSTEIAAKNLPLATLRLHRKGWASTSMDSPTAKHVCEKCGKGKDMKRSLFVDLGHD